MMHVLHTLANVALAGLQWAAGGLAFLADVLALALAVWLGLRLRARIRAWRFRRELARKNAEAMQAMAQADADMAQWAEAGGLLEDQARAIRDAMPQPRETTERRMAILEQGGRVLLKIERQGQWFQHHGDAWEGHPEEAA